MIRLLLLLAPLALAFPAAAQDHSSHQPAPDPHAHHRPPPPADRDPHAGHAPAEPAPDADSHAGHDMGAVQDPHAGHAMPADPHAGHRMTDQVTGPPDIPTSADTPGRPGQTPPPPGAFTGPVHAADLLFDPAEMAAAREQLRLESGAMRTSALIVDRLEAGFGDGEETFGWDIQGWSGGDINRLWLKSEGGGTFGDGVGDVEVQALYGRAVTPFWDVQAGVRHDFRRGADDVTHLVLGVQGVAPHWWEIDAAAFLSTEGDLTARIEAEYDQRITQRLILQPRFEIDLSASDVPERQVGSGLTSIEAGLRLRYEIRPEFAPYVGVEWSRAFGDTADYIEAAGGERAHTRLLVGLRAWF